LGHRGTRYNKSEYGRGQDQRTFHDHLQKCDRAPQFLQ
jgi:hypothetical protein